MRMSKAASLSVVVVSLGLMWALIGIGGENPGETRCVPCTRGNPELRSYHCSYSWGGDWVSYEQPMFWYLSADWAEHDLHFPGDGQALLDESAGRGLLASATTYPVTVYTVVPVPEVIRSGGLGTWFIVDYRYFPDRDPQRQWDGSFYWIEVRVFDLTGRQVALVSRENSTQVWWSVGTLGNGAYIYSATVKDTWLGRLLTFGPFRGYVYIER